MIEIDNLLQSVVQARASDLHLAVGTPPVVRVNGGLKMVQRNGALSPQDIEDVLTSITTPESMASFLRDKELDFAYGKNGLARFRVNACYQRGTISLSFRVLSADIPTAESLNLPPHLSGFCEPTERPGTGDRSNGQWEVHDRCGNDKSHQ